jgi:surfactin synthase thioesterase subunit
LYRNRRQPNRPASDAPAADAEEAAEHLSDRSILALITEIKKIQNDLAGNPNLKGTLAMLADTLFRAAQN